MLKVQHTKKFYEKWLSNNNLTLSDVVVYIHNHTGRALEKRDVIDFLHDNNYSAWDLTCIFER